ncbi:MAG: hypothetical protein IPN77_32190 [Sandaracinaceae bacterium]|nr:hypothetical protein [Sandaracinaceae bacterium]
MARHVAGVGAGPGGTILFRQSAIPGCSGWRGSSAASWAPGSWSAVHAYKDALEKGGEK